jgi:hypothetical protein
MHPVLRLTAPALLIVLLLSACGSTKGQADGQDDTTVQVINRNWLSMEIYVVGQSQRVQLGRVGTGDSKQFTIPAHLLSGATPLRFVMESSGPQRDVLSEEFVVAPGEEVILVIPNTR